MNYNRAVRLSLWAWKDRDELARNCQGISQCLESGHPKYILRVTLSFPLTGRQTTGPADICDTRPWFHS